MLAMAGLVPRDMDLALVIGPLLALVLVFPTLRTLALALGAALTLGRFVRSQQDRHLDVVHPDAELVASIAVVILVLLLYACFRTAARFRELPQPVRKWPQLWLHAALWAALGIAWYLPRDSPAFGSALMRATAACLPFLVWRCGYLLLSGKRGTAARSSFADHFMYLMPVYGGTPVPYGKGYDNLADSDEAIRARSQLAGLRLLLLAWTWVGARWLMSTVVYGDGPLSLHLVRLAVLIDAAATIEVPIGTRWVIVTFELVHRTLNLAISGHFVIGTLRLFGFNVFRNTYKPLLSESLVDFWNRFYYYFKELLVEFFFFPTYLSVFKTRPRIRLFAATVAAACLGNLYYHVLLYLPELASAGPIGALALMSSRVLYSSILAVGIFVSLVRQQQLRGRSGSSDAGTSSALRFRRIAGVWLFYAIIQIWNVEPIDLTFAQRTRFFLTLLGI